MTVGRRGVALLFLTVTLAAGVAVQPARADNERPNECTFVWSENSQNRSAVAVHGQPG